ncbi:heavy-metal-associated domain-containing protein [Kitasatospora arboriphila]
MSSTVTYTVAGMSCGHCEKSVTAEVSGIAGVTEVAADAKAGTVTVSSAAPLDDEQVRAAVDEAATNSSAAPPETAAGARPEPAPPVRSSEEMR